MKKNFLPIIAAMLGMAAPASAQSYLMQIHHDGTVTEIEADKVEKVTFTLKQETPEAVPTGTDLRRGTPRTRPRSRVRKASAYCWRTERLTQCRA